MYFAMKSIGNENTEVINKLASLKDKWQFIDKIAKNMGFEGIQFDNTFFNIPLDKIPEYIKKFRLTYHIDDTLDFTNAQKVDTVNREVEKSLYRAVENNIEDVSIHPPGVRHESHMYRNEFAKKFSDFIEVWLPKFEKEGITFSVECHVGGNFFLFDSLVNFAKFFPQHPNLGVLIDVSHNFNDGCTISEIHDIIKPLNITGFHLSDGISGVDVRKGTHLPVGHGEINFSDFLKPFTNAENICGALEINSTNANIAESLLKLKHFVIA